MDQYFQPQKNQREYSGVTIPGSNDEGEIPEVAPVIPEDVVSDENEQEEEEHVQLNNADQGRSRHILKDKEQRFVDAIHAVFLELLKTGVGCGELEPALRPSFVILCIENQALGNPSQKKAPPEEWGDMEYYRGARVRT